MKYNIKIYFKNKESLKQAFKFFTQLKTSVKTLRLNFSLVEKKRKRKLIAVLKSPHVNKKAQEHFQISTYKAVATYVSLEAGKSHIFLKKIKNHVFPGAKLKVEKTFLNLEEPCSVSFAPIKKLIKTSRAFTFLNLQRRFPLFTESCKEGALLKKAFEYLKKLDTHGMRP